MDDGWIYFSNLNHIIAEDVYSVVDHEEHLFRFNSMDLKCVVDDLDAELTLVIEPKIVDGIITRKVYVAVNSKGTIPLKRWERCLSALFSFIFSTQISGSKIWPFKIGKYPEDLSVVTISSKEIKCIRKNYKRLYRQMILELPVIVGRWATKWFDHAARPLGIYKYLETVQRSESIFVELKISLISEAFVQYFGDRDNSSAEKCIKHQYHRLSNHAGVRLRNDGTIKKIWTFYGNFKHFRKGHKETSPVEVFTDDERVQLSYFAGALFQFAVLYELLEDDVDTFKSFYSELVKHHEVLNKIYAI